MFMHEHVYLHIFVPAWLKQKYFCKTENLQWSISKDNRSKFLCGEAKDSLPATPRCWRQLLLNVAQLIEFQGDLLFHIETFFFLKNAFTFTRVIFIHFYDLTKEKTINEQKQNKSVSGKPLFTLLHIRQVASKVIHEILVSACCKCFLGSLHLNQLNSSL